MQVLIINTTFYAMFLSTHTQYVRARLAAGNMRGECCHDIGSLAFDLSEAGKDLLRQQALLLHLPSSCRVTGCVCD